MQTDIHPNLIKLTRVQQADEILRSCVHCGFCTATCPTYQLLGDELDGPRGRIYLIKGLLEDDAISVRSAAHLDRCLTCRSCETTCPSGVRYGRLLDIARDLVRTRVDQPRIGNLLARLLRLVVPRKSLFVPLLRLGQLFRPILPRFLATRIPRTEKELPVQVRSHDRLVVLLEGCVQKAATPNVNRAITLLLDQIGVGVEHLSREGCCGALDYHLAAHDAGKRRMRELIDQLYPRLDSIEAIISSASGCGVTIKEYPEVLEDDAEYADRAKAVAGKVLDVSELLATANFSPRTKGGQVRAALHEPCSLQHGQRINGVIEGILARAGIEVVPSAEGHLCCGSAGTYSIVHPRLGARLRDRKLDALSKAGPEAILTANVGCQLHLQTGTDIPVMHWTEMLQRVCV